MEGTIAEIRMFAGNFAPMSWAFCQNQTMSIAQNTALFSLLGTTYGGNGQTTFNLPDLRGRIALGTGQGPGLPVVQLGELAGTATTTLLTGNLPIHNHPLTGSVNQQVNNDTAGLSDDATNKRQAATGQLFTATASDLVNMAPAASTLAVGLNGSNQPIGTMPPYSGMNFIICLQGIYPSRN
jgi:microcystin-dependent protein